MKKKTMSFALAAILILAANVFAASPVSAATLSDTSGHWAEGQILAGINYGYINGYPDGTFKPEGTISRAEFVTIINKARNYTTMTNIPFRDVPVNEWYFQEVQRAYHAGYIQGDSEGNFNPNAQITRQEAAIILNNIAPGGDTSYALTGVRDADRIESWALLSVRAVYSRGYITGDAEGNFNPTNPLKRGEAVTIVNRVLGINPLSPGSELAALNISNINVSDIKSDSALLNITATRDGNVYWVVLTGSDATTPTAAQVLNGLAANGSKAYSSNGRTVYANSAISVSLSSLEAEQSYKVCAVARDAASNLSTVAVSTFATSNAGDTGEEWLSSNFVVSSIANNSFTLTVNSSRAGTLYYVVVEDPNRNVKTPVQSYIRNGRDASNSSSNVISGSFVVSAGASKSEYVTGLKGGTNYKVFGCVYESSSTGSLYSKVKSYAFTTTGSNVNWITNFEVSQIGATSAVLSVRTDRAGTFYYVVTTDSRQPTVDQIRRGQDYNSIVSSVYGGPYIAANTYAYPSLSPLSTNTTGYHVFGVLLYTTTGEWSEIERYDFTTTGTPATALNSSASYTLTLNSVTTSGGIIAFTAGSNTSYSAPQIILSSADKDANVTITVTKASAVTVALSANGVTKPGTGSTATGSSGAVSFAIGGLQIGNNTIVITVAESNRTSLTYTLTIYKPAS
ncbi:MAG: S-layer homology domain-containing protein [Clostridiales Family XIII bacterium]|jgi:hypothetical protein|nr:S-layer homology domain-containing protein [Clostridiales Family XIII bacterium]